MFSLCANIIVCLHEVGPGWRYTPLIQALVKLRQEDQDFKAILGYIVISYLEKKKSKMAMMLLSNTILWNPVVMQFIDMQHNTWCNSSLHCTCLDSCSLELICSFFFFFENWVKVCILQKDSFFTSIIWGHYLALCWIFFHPISSIMRLQNCKKQHRLWNIQLKSNH